MMEIIENCIRKSDSSGLHALRSIWDHADPDKFSSNNLLESRRTLLMSASKLGHLKCCKFLLSIDSPSINTRLRDSRYLKPAMIFPGLFDFSGTFLNDLTEKLKNLPQEKCLQHCSMTNCKNDEENNFKSDQALYNHDTGDVKNEMSSFDIIGKKLVDTDKCSSIINSSSSSGKSNHGNIDNHSNNRIKDKSTKPGGDDDILSDGEIIEKCNENQNVISSLDEQKNDDIHRKKKIQKNENLPFQETSKSSGVVGGISRYEASKYCIEIISVLDDDENKLINQPITFLLSQNETISRCPDKLEMKESGSRFKSEKALSIDKKNVMDDFTIGRSRKNDFNIDDLSVSKNHAIISYYNNVGFILRDLGSKHGTFVDGKRIGIKNEKIINVHEIGKSIPLGNNNGLILTDGMSIPLGNNNGLILTDGMSIPLGNNNGLILTDGMSIPLGNNNGLILTDGMTLQFGRVICKIFRKRQSAILSHGFQPSKNSERKPQDSEEIAGKKRTALMALYGHYEKTPNLIGVRNSGISSGSGSRSSVSSAVEIQEKLKVGKVQKAQLEVEYHESQQQQIQQMNHNHYQSQSQCQDNEREFHIDQQMEVGATLLRKMGWEGTAIGRSGAQAAKPLCAVLRPSKEGLGCNHVVKSGTIDEIHNIENRNGDSKKTKLRNKMIDRYHSIT